MIHTCEQHLGDGLRQLVDAEGAEDIRIQKTGDGTCSGCDRPAVWSLTHGAR
jgi:hypothetical protein